MCWTLSYSVIWSNTGHVCLYCIRITSALVKLVINLVIRLCNIRVNHFIKCLIIPYVTAIAITNIIKCSVVIQYLRSVCHVWLFTFRSTNHLRYFIIWIFNVLGHALYTIRSTFEIYRWYMFDIHTLKEFISFRVTCLNHGCLEHDIPGHPCRVLVRIVRVRSEVTRIFFLSFNWGFECRVCRRWGHGVWL